MAELQSVAVGAERGVQSVVLALVVVVVVVVMVAMGLLLIVTNHPIVTHESQHAL
jgi:hypothetical protein